MKVELITRLMAEVDRWWRMLCLGRTCLMSSKIMPMAQYVHRDSNIAPE